MKTKAFSSQFEKSTIWRNVAEGTWHVIAMCLLWKHSNASLKTSCIVN